LLLGGVNSFNLLRSIMEIEAWADKLEGGDGALLHKTRAEVVNWMWGSGLGRRKNVEERLHTVPRGVEGYEKVHEVQRLEPHAGEGVPLMQGGGEGHHHRAGEGAEGQLRCKSQ
jgi:hypothetical protein